MANENQNNQELNIEKIKPNMVKKTIRFFISLVLILVIGYVILNYVPFIAKYSNHVIVTDSMEPVINVNDVVVIDNSYGVNDLNVGEIIAFNVDLNADGTEEIVVHYIFSIEEVDGETIIKTIAHDKEVSDPWELSPDDILGKHVLTIRSIGSFLRFASSTFGRIVLIFDVIIIYFIIELFSEKDKKEKEEKELENQASDDEILDEQNEIEDQEVK